MRIWGWLLSLMWYGTSQGGQELQEEGEWGNIAYQASPPLASRRVSGNRGESNETLHQREAWIQQMSLDMSNQHKKPWPSRIWTKHDSYIVSVETFTHSQFQRYMLYGFRVRVIPCQINTKNRLTLWSTICTTCSSKNSLSFGIITSVSHTVWVKGHH